MSSEEKSPEKLVGALVSGLSVLRYLSEARTPVGATRVARDLGLNPSTCFNLLKTLVYEDLIVFDEATKTYSIGLGLLSLAHGVLEQTGYIPMMQPYLRELAAKHKVTCTLWHVVPGERVILAGRADNDAAIRVHMSLGQRLPMYLGALGRCMAAYSGLSEAKLRSRFAKLKWETDLPFQEYMAQVHLVHERGYAVDAGYYVKGATSVASAVLDSSGKPLMAISAVGFSAQLTAQHIADLGAALHRNAAMITAAMTGRSTVPGR